MVFRHLGRIEEDNWCSKYRTFKVSGSFPRGRPQKTQNEVIRSDFKDQQVIKDRGKNKCLEVFYKKSCNPYKHEKQTLK